MGLCFQIYFTFPPPVCMIGNFLELYSGLTCLSRPILHVEKKFFTYRCNVIFSVLNIVCLTCYFKEPWNIVKYGKDANTNHIDFGPTISTQKSCFQREANSYITFDCNTYCTPYTASLSNHSNRIYHQWGNVGENVVKIKSEPFLKARPCPFIQILS